MLIISLLVLQFLIEKDYKEYGMVCDENDNVDNQLAPGREGGIT